MRMLIAVLTLAMSGPVFGQKQEACDPWISTAELARHISRADVAFAKMDQESFRAARWEIDRALPCMGAPIQIGQVAALYRMQALGSFMDQEHAQAVGWFKGVFEVAPHYVLPETLAPQGHPLRIDFEVAQGTPDVAGDPIRRPAVGVIRIDGKVGTELPRDRPYLFQHVDDSGGVRITAMVRPGIEPPRYPTVRGVQTRSRSRQRAGVVKAERERQTHINIPLVALASAAALTSGVSYAVAASKEKRFWNRATPDGDLESLRTQTNTWVWVSVGTGTLAAGAGVAAVLTGTW